MPTPPRSFSEVVDSLQSAITEDDEYTPAPSLVSGVAAQVAAEPAYISPNTLSQIYSSTIASLGLTNPEVAPHHKPRELAPPPLAIPSTKPADIARELNVRRSDTVQDLLDLRRRFALANHPDRVAPGLRDAATVRMGIANTMIDDAIKARESHG